MGIEKPQEPKSFAEVHKILQDIYNNISLADMRAGDVRESAPTAETLDKTRMAVFDDGTNAPSIFYRARNGTVYQFSGTPV